jgi:transposase
LSAYRGRNKSSESCFKFLKDKTHNLNQICLKKESRTEAMMMAMSLVLFTNNLAQAKLRNLLKENNKSIPAQRGKETQKPNFKWASYFMRNITKVKIKVNDIIYDQIKGIDQGAEAIIRAFGEHALMIYGLTKKTFQK